MTALYTRYRSQRFDDLVGQDALVQTLKNALTSGRVAHAYLFAGIRGTGKTSTARILAKAVNCTDPQAGEPCNRCASCTGISEGSATDLIEIDAASNRGIDEMRDLREKAKYMPALLRRKVYIIDEAHQLTGDAFNALLKTLEEPPEHVLFILCTTEAHKLPETVVSRCQRFEFRRIDEAGISGRLRHIAKSEEIAATDDGLALIAAMARGSLRDGVTMLDQVSSSGAPSVDAESVRRQLGLVQTTELVSLLAECQAAEGGAALRRLDRLVQQGADLRQLAYSIAEVARGLLLAGLGSGLSAGAGLNAEAAAELEQLAQVTTPGFARAAFELAVSAAAEMRQAHDPRLVLELVLVRLASQTPAVSPTPAHPRQEAVPVPPPARVTAPLEAPAAEAVPAAVDPVEVATVEVATMVATESPVDAGGELGSVLAAWERVLDALRATTPGIRLKALLNDGAPVALDGDQLTIAFRYALHRDRAEEPAHRQALEGALSLVYGQAFRLQFRVDPGLQAGRPAPPRSGPTEPATAEAQAPPPGVPVGADGDLPRAAVEILGGRITDIRPRGVREAS